MPLARAADKNMADDGRGGQQQAVAGCAAALGGLVRAGAAARGRGERKRAGKEKKKKNWRRKGRKGRLLSSSLITLSLRILTRASVSLVLVCTRMAEAVRCMGGGGEGARESGGEKAALRG